MSTSSLRSSRSTRTLLGLLTAALLALGACSDPPTAEPDASMPDAGLRLDAAGDAAGDGGTDAGTECGLGYVPSEELPYCVFDGGLDQLAVSVGVLSPEFSPETLAYTVAVPLAETAITITPSVAAPVDASITIDGVDAISGEPAVIADLEIGAPRPVEIVVTARSGRVTRYTVVVTRFTQEAYVKASNQSGLFGGALAISSDGTTLAVGARRDGSVATGIDGDSSQSASGMDSGAVYVFRRESDGWAQEAFVKASNTGRGDAFGEALALSSDGSTLVVGAPGERSDATGVNGDQGNDRAVSSGAAYVFRRSADIWSQQAYLKASNTQEGDRFGASVAVSGDGTGIVVGAPDEDGNATADPTTNNASGAGAAYGFRYAGTSWAQTTYVKASNAESSDRFGSAIAICEDGSTLAVGALGESSSATQVGGNQANNDVDAAGAVYVFTRSAGSWLQSAYIKATNPGVDDFFGSAVALSGDGSSLAVGAAREDGGGRSIGAPTDDASPQSGAVYLYARSPGGWFVDGYFKASNGSAGDLFGGSVSLSIDGTWLLVGASDEASSATGLAGDFSDDGALHAGAGYLFRRTSGVWQEAVYMKASNTDAEDRFGSAVAVSGDGSTLVVGAPSEASTALGVGGDESNDDGLGRGAVYVFR